MKPSLTKNNPYAPYLLLLIQPIFMATNTIVARGGVESVPPISLAFWRWFTVFIILFPFFFNEILKNKKDFNKEFFKLFFLGSMGCGICGAFPNLAGMTTTMANIGIIYTSSPVIIIFLSILFFKEKINFFRILGLFICIAGVFRFTLIAMCGFMSLFPFFILENIYFAKTNYNQTFLFWIVFAAISPSIIAFSLYTRLQKYVGASFAGFTLYLFAVYGSIFGIIIFEEPLLSFHYLGGLLVFTGVYFARKKV